MHWRQHAPNPPVIAGTRIGHVHLKVAISTAWGSIAACSALSDEKMARPRRSFRRRLSHHIGSTPGEQGRPSAAAGPPGCSTPILYHRPALADALHRVMTPASSSTRQRPRVSEALYLPIPTRTVRTLWDGRGRVAAALLTAASMFTERWISTSCCSRGKSNSRHWSEQKHPSSQQGRLNGLLSSLRSRNDGFLPES